MHINDTGICTVFVHISVILRGFSKGPSLFIFLFFSTVLYSSSSYSSLLISSYSSRRAILRLLILLLLYFKLFIVLQTCIIIIYVHISIILRGFSKGPSFFYLLILLFCTALYSSCLLYYRHAYETHTE